MILSVIEYCASCGLCFYYPIMLVDDDDVLRVIGEPMDRCECGLCLSCCKKRESNRLHENRLLSL